VTVHSAPPRSPRGADTRSLIIATAERLFAIHGVAAVSNRQLSEAAGQANNSVIAYHFGTRADLLRAIVRHHQPDIEQRRMAMLDAGDAPTTLRDWINCEVRPITEHYAGLGHPGWYARFAAQATTDPAVRHLVIEEVLTQPSMRQALDGVAQLMPALPGHVHRRRADMSRLLIVHLCAEHERSLQDETADVTWEQIADSLVDALIGIWLAPVSNHIR
jgi:AcrR family transcriptional regulator